MKEQRGFSGLFLELKVPHIADNIDEAVKKVCRLVCQWAYGCRCRRRSPHRLDRFFFRIIISRRFNFTHVVAFHLLCSSSAQFNFSDYLP